MTSTSHIEQLLGLAGVLAAETSPDSVLAAALPVLVDIADADAGIVVHRTADGLRTTGAGPDLEQQDLGDLHDCAGERLGGVPVPASWLRAGITQVAAQRLPSRAGAIVLAWRAEHDLTDVLTLALVHLTSSLVRAQTEESLSDLVSRVDNAQHLAHMGDYDWHIPSDKNTWSDELFRIYGHEPQSFNPSYETFLSLVHPDDRERIIAVHQQAYASGEPYEMIERIVRPGGEVRYLSSNGEVIKDEDGQPLRFRGTCVDITERVLADQERERIAARFQGLVDSAPDAILVLGEDQRVLEANQRARELLGGDPQHHRIEEFLPGWPQGGTAGVDAYTLEGKLLQLDVITTGVNLAGGTDPGSQAQVALFLRDAHPRLEGEAVAARLSEAQLRRRQALEINDNVVQGLVAAVYALDQGLTDTSMSYLDRTLSAARAMMDDLLDPLDGVGLQPGDLVRTSPAVLGTQPDAVPQSDAVPQPEAITPVQRSHSVLVVDDAEDLRTLLRLRMESYRGLTVVGEAADGLAAVELAAELQPDLVLLDLAMPRMDGLEALPLIRAAVPGVRVIVLSGFNQSTLAQKALEAGADHYVVKGGSMSRLLELVDSLLEPA